MRLPPDITRHTGEVLNVHEPSARFSDLHTPIIEAERGWFVVKTGPHAEYGHRLRTEADVLARLTDHRPFVPSFIDSARDGDDDVFLFDYLPGISMTALLPGADRDTVAGYCKELGRVLREIHGWNVDAPKPADWWEETWDRATRAAEGQLESLVQLPGVFEGKQLVDVLRVGALARRHTVDLCWIHGDPCLPNWLLSHGRITGAIDWPEARYADRRWDLATVLWTIPYNLRDTPHSGEEMNSIFLDAYGFTGSDEELLPYLALNTILDRVSFRPPDQSVASSS